MGCSVLSSHSGYWPDPIIAKEDTPAGSIRQEVQQELTDPVASAHVANTTWLHL